MHHLQFRWVPLFWKRFPNKFLTNKKVSLSEIWRKMHKFTTHNYLGAILTHIYVGIWQPSCFYNHMITQQPLFMRLFDPQNLWFDPGFDTKIIVLLGWKLRKLELIIGIWQPRILSLILMTWCQKWVPCMRKPIPGILSKWLLAAPSWIFNFLKRNLIPWI